MRPDNLENLNKLLQSHGIDGHLGSSMIDDLNNQIAFTIDLADRNDPLSSMKVLPSFQVLFERQHTNNKGSVIGFFVGMLADGVVFYARSTSDAKSNADTLRAPYVVVRMNIFDSDQSANAFIDELIQLNLKESLQAAISQALQSIQGIAETYGERFSNDKSRMVIEDAMQQLTINSIFDLPLPEMR